MSEVKTRKRQMKFVGAVWCQNGKFSQGMKQYFTVDEVEWMLEKAKDDPKGRVMVFTEERKYKRPSAKSPTHTSIVYVYEGEWGWDETMPVKEVEMNEGRGKPVPPSDDPF